MKYIGFSLRDDVKKNMKEDKVDEIEIIACPDLQISIDSKGNLIFHLTQEKKKIIMEDLEVSFLLCRLHDTYTMNIYTPKDEI